VLHWGMTRLLDRAIAEIARLPESDQDRIGRELFAYVEGLRALRAELDRGIASLDAGEGGELDIEAVITRAHQGNGGG